MRRSQAPSQQSFATPSPKCLAANKENKSLRRTCDDQRVLKKAKLASNQDANCKSSESPADGCSSQESRDEHDLVIEKILKKPFKIPIANYNGPLLGRSLGIKRSGCRSSLHDPFGENALVLFSPPELSEHDKMNSDASKQPVHVVFAELRW